MNNFKSIERSQSSHSLSPVAKVFGSIVDHEPDQKILLLFDATNVKTKETQKMDLIETSLNSLRLNQRNKHNDLRQEILKVSH